MKIFKIFHIQSIRAKITLLFFLTSILFMFFYFISTYFFTSSVQDSMHALSQESYVSVSKVAEKALFEKEIATISNLMDEKIYRVNTILSDLERLVEFEEIFIVNLLKNKKYSNKKVFTPQDFVNNTSVLHTLSNDDKYDVKISLDYPDLMLRNKNKFSHFSYLYWELTPVFKNLYNQYKHVLWTYIGFEEDGTFLNYPGTYADPPDYDPRTRPWYKTAKKSKTLIWEKPYFDSGQGLLVVTVAKPIFHPITNQFYAVVGTDLLLKNFTADIVNNTNNYHMSFVILDEQNQILYKNGDEKLLGNWKKETYNSVALKKYLDGIDIKAINNIRNNGVVNLPKGTSYIFKRKLERVNWTILGVLKKENTVTAYQNTILQLDLLAKKTKNKIHRFINIHYRHILFLIILGLLSLIASYFLLKKVFMQPFSKVVSYIENIDIEKDDFKKSVKQDYSKSDEIGVVYQALSDYHNKLAEYKRRLKINLESNAIAQTARQVAHDIRSPLTALSSLASDLSELPEEKRILLRTAVHSIEDIANDLSTKRLNHSTSSGHEAQGARLKGDDNQDKQTSTQLVSSIIEQIVSEKRVQYRDKNEIDIATKQSVESYGLFADINAKEFKRVLSNVINNAVEALGDEGKIRVFVSAGGPEGRGVGGTIDGPVVSEVEPFTDLPIYITIKDNGKGIPADILPQLMQEGKTFGKEKHEKSGSGLGLYHARKTIQGWGGDVRIESEVGKGTSVIIELPKQTPPNWFLPSLALNSSNLRQGSGHELKAESSKESQTERTTKTEQRTPSTTRIVVLDDDNSIHQVWENRLIAAGVAKEEIVHFKNPEKMISWAQNSSKGENTFHLSPFSSSTEQCRSVHLFLCDYELLGSKKTGLDVIEELGIAKNAVLVTSHFEEDDICERCARLGVKLLPKNLAGFVPISVDSGLEIVDRVKENKNAQQTTNTNSESQTTNSDTIDAILIDDAHMVHMTWKMMAKKFDKKVAHYKDPDEFFNESSKFSKDVPVYIDSNLEKEKKGEEYAKEIYDMGFKEIYLATGDHPDEFKEMPWIKDIVGKEAPWRNA